MKTVCAWCELEGRETILGRVDQIDPTAVRYGICADHAARLVAKLHQYYPPASPPLAA